MCLLQCLWGLLTVQRVDSENEIKTVFSKTAHHRKMLAVRKHVLWTCSIFWQSVRIDVQRCWTKHIFVRKENVSRTCQRWGNSERVYSLLIRSISYIYHMAIKDSSPGMPYQYQLDHQVKSPLATPILHYTLHWKAAPRLRRRFLKFSESSLS